MFIEELKLLLANLDDEYSKNEWIIPQFIKKNLVDMAPFDAFKSIDIVVNILLDKNNKKYWTEIFSILFSLVRRSNTTEMPNALKKSIYTIKKSSKQISSYDYNQCVELLSFYRIDENDEWLENSDDNSYYGFHITTMPNTRLADFYLGCLDDSVFIDFSYNDNQLIELTRISFDGYGCCNINKKSTSLDENDSKVFIKMFKENIIDQYKMAQIVRKIIKENIDLLWKDAIEEYGLI